MSTEKSEAILIRSVAWSETSLVVTLYTRTHGKVSAVAKGARRLKSPFETALDLLAKSHVVFIEKSSDSLDILTEAKLIRSFRSGRRNLLALYSGYYLAEVVNLLTQNHQPDALLFDALDDALEHLDADERPAKVVLKTELEFLSRLGHLPSFELCVGCGNPVESGRNGSYLFGIEAGGVLCDNCLVGQNHILRVREETIGFLRQASKRQWPDWDWEIPKETRGEVRFVMEKFITFLADRRLRLMDFTEELKR